MNQALPNRHTPYFSRETTNIIKGVALILMFIHHFFTFPATIVCQVDYPWIETFAAYFESPTSICVSVFAFLTGCFYYYASQKTYRYSVKKILDLLIPYWGAYLLLLVISLAVGYRPSLRGFLTEFLGMKIDVMIFCWYVRFYILVMLVLPIYVKFVPENRFFSLVTGLLLPYIVLYLLTTVPSLRSPLLSLAEHFPTVAVGYLFARHDLFRSWFDTLPGHDKTGRFQWLKWVVFLGAVLWAKWSIPSVMLGSLSYLDSGIPLYFSTDLIYAPCFVYGLVRLFRVCPPWKLLRTALAEVGKMSMLMWFLHSAFYNHSAALLQPILYFPRNPVLVLLWGLLLCYAAARAIDALCKPLIRLKDRLLAK